MKLVSVCMLVQLYVCIIVVDYGGRSLLAVCVHACVRVCVCVSE